MKRWVWFVAAVVAVAALEGASSDSDVADLDPVQVVYMDVEGRQVLVETDQGARGTGETLESALEDMERTWASEVFLETAEFLVVSEEAQGRVGELWKVLRPSCEVCVGVGELELERVAEHLHRHKPGVTLMEYQAGERQLPRLVAQEGRMELVP
ncbi:MAG: hypothetical protein IJW45_09640 [Oscillospiraceae bacterium]|nr:hypothetical protein [Oscillospiraceae bacterium]